MKGILLYLLVTLWLAATSLPVAGLKSQITSWTTEVEKDRLERVPLRLHVPRYPEKCTLSRGVVQLAGSVYLLKQLAMAAAVIVTIPVLALFFFFERRLVRGLTAGTMKG